MKYDKIKDRIKVLEHEGKFDSQFQTLVFEYLEAPKEELSYIFNRVYWLHHKKGAYLEAMTCILLSEIICNRPENAFPAVYAAVDLGWWAEGIAIIGYFESIHKQYMDVNSSLSSFLKCYCFLQAGLLGAAREMLPLIEQDARDWLRGELITKDHLERALHT